MKILLTGAFGNIGCLILEKLIERGHDVTCFDLSNNRNIKTAQSYSSQPNSNKINIAWGDIRDKALMATLLKDKEAVIHMAAMLPPTTDLHPALSWDINVKGTELLLALMEEIQSTALFVFASSVSVYGFRQSDPPPRTIDEPLVGTDNYSKQKIACEGLIKNSKLKWCILRLGASVDERMHHSSKGQMNLLFQTSGDNRVEYIHPGDVALAISNALECPEAHNKVHLIGGGKSCQIHYIDMVHAVTEAMGLTFEKSDFADKPYYTDWMDTVESQRLLKFQEHSFEGFRAAAFKKFWLMRFFVKPISPIVKFFIRRMLK